MTKVAKFIKWLGIGALLTGAVAGSFLWGPKLYTRFVPQTDTNAKQNEARFIAVRRDDLQIMITEDGKLRAIKNHAIYPELKGQSKIAWLVPEGTSVKKGDKLIEFDKKPREEILRTKSADLEGQQRGVTVAEEALRIQISSSKASLRAAETKLHDTQVALRVYENLDGPKKLNDMDAAITDARAKYNTKLKDLADTQKKIDEQLFIEEQQRKALDKELTQAKESLDTARKAVDTAILQQKIFRRYDYPQNLNAKKQAVDTAQLDVDKASVAAKSEVNQKTQELAKISDGIRRLTQDIKDLNDEMGKCTLTAPTDGMVLYGDPMHPWRYYGEQSIRVGMDWYGSNILMTIPDTSAFEIAISIGEEYRGKVNPGAKATITVEAIPGLVIDGELKKIESSGTPAAPRSSTPHFSPAATTPA
jgi:HlyD family secretion protein